MAHGYYPSMTSSDSILGYLQELLLVAAMLGERLPGARRPLRLLSSSGLHDIPSKIVRPNLAQSLKVDDLPRRLEVLPAEQLKLEEHLGTNQEMSFLAFRPAVWHEDRVELSMVVGEISRRDGDVQCREIGHVNAEFHEINGRWSAVGEPHVYLAYER